MERSERLVTAHGKQVMLAGKHLADARDEIAARALADALEYITWGIPEQACRNIQELLR